MNPIAHIEINVSNLQKFKEFYNKLLSSLGWKISSETKNSFGFKATDKTHLFLVQTNSVNLTINYHRKAVGLNHIAFRVPDKQTVETFYQLLKSYNIKTLYTEGPADYSAQYHMKEYYAVFFEDPDRIKLEVVHME